MLFVQSSFSQSEQQWELAKDKNNVKVYIKNSPGSKLKEFKAIAHFQGVASKAIELLDHPENYKDWMANCSSSKVLEKTNNKQVAYFLTKLPWPITDRDAVFAIDKTDQAGSTVYTHSCEPQKQPEIDGTIRIKTAQGKWTVTPQADKKIEIIYQYYADPGGTIPAWIINMFIVSGPYETLLNLEKLIQ